MPTPEIDTPQQGRGPITRRIGGVHAGRLVTRPAALALLVCLVVLSYSNTFFATFHFDDEPNILEYAAVKDLSRFWDIAGTRYVGFLSFALNYHVGRFDVFGYHLVNLVIHVANSFLIYGLIVLLFRAPTVSGTRELRAIDGVAPLSGPIAITTALLFAVHPMQTQAVTYIVQRYTNLVTLFYLLGVVCYLRWRLAEGGGWARAWWYAAALGSTLLAMKTKEISFTLPFMLVVIEAALFRPRGWKPWLALIPFLLTLPIIPASLNKGMGQAGLGFARETLAIDRLSYLFTQFRVIVTYLRLLVFPVGQNLDYDYPIYHSLWEPAVLASALFLLGTASVGVHLLRSSPRLRLVGFGVIWFFVTLSVESSVIPIHDVIFEHRVYLASPGFFLAGSVLLVEWLGRRPVAVAMGVGLIAATLSAATYQRNRVWQNELTLWTDVVAKSPGKPRARNNLATAYAKLGRFDEAEAEYLIALQLDPDRSETHNDLGVAYAKQGRLDDAIREYAIALRLQPNDPSIHYNFGNAYLRQGRVDEAIREYQTALKRDPEFPDIHNNLGNAYFQQGRLDEAVQEYVLALKLDPENPDIHTNLGAAYAKQGHLEAAIREYQFAIGFDQNLPDAHYNLGVAYAKQNRLDEAIAEYLVAVKLNPSLFKAHYNLGQAYRLRGSPGEAKTHFETALRINPDFSPAKQALAAL
jgi:tetratricopeptide (TPR) repeat protein